MWSAIDILYLQTLASAKVKESSLPEDCANKSALSSKPSNKDDATLRRSVGGRSFHALWPCFSKLLIVSSKDCNERENITSITIYDIEIKN